MTLTTSITSTGSTAAVTGGLPPIRQIKSELTAALVAAGISDAKATDVSPKGFPKGVGWTDAYRMVIAWKEDGNPATPGTPQISAAALKSSLGATRTLADMGVTDLSAYPRGSTVAGVLDSIYRDTGNGKLASVMSRAGIYDLSAFPPGTTIYQAFKLVEDPENPGKVSAAQFASYKASAAALKSLGITSLANFPRATTLPQAAAMLEPKASQMLAMVGVDKSQFKDMALSSLSAVALLTQLPNSIQQLRPLPAGQTSANLAKQAAAAQKLVAMGYDSLAPFAAMASFAGATPSPTAALAAVTKKPALADLPAPASASTERLFQPTVSSPIRSYGIPNPVTSSVFTPPAAQKVTPNGTAGKVMVVTAAQVLEFNRSFWAPKS